MDEKSITLGIIALFAFLLLTLIILKGKNRYVRVAVVLSLVILAVVNGIKD